MPRLATLTIRASAREQIDKYQRRANKICPNIQTFSTSSRCPLSPRERIAGCVCDQLGELYLILYTELIVFVFIWRGVVACRKNTRTQRFSAALISKPLRQTATAA
jgi:hypothetical protein